MDTIKCPDCRGKGKVKVPSYRDNASLFDSKPSGKERLMCWLSKIKTGLKAVSVVCIAGGFTLALILPLRRCNEQAIATLHQREAQEQEQARQAAKQGWLTVQYGPDSITVVRCWNTKNTGLEVHSPSAFIRLNDRDNPSKEAAALGVSDVSQCIRMGE